MSNEFTGFPKEMFEFFMQINFNNNVEWFAQNRDQYEQYVKKPLHALADALAPTILQLDNGMEVRPGKVCSRIRRDTRFSHNKLPFRDNMWLAFYRQGEDKNACVNFYMGISCDHTEYGLGWYMGSPDRARQLREAILRKKDDFNKIVANKKLNERFTLGGEQYKKLAIPEELPEATIPYYLAKGFYLGHGETTGKQVMQPAFAEQIAEDFKLFKPMMDFFNHEHIH